MESLMLIQLMKFQFLNKIMLDLLSKHYCLNALRLCLPRLHLCGQKQSNINIVKYNLK